MDGGNWASIIAAIVAALSAVAVARSSANANRRTKQLESQAAVDAEKIRQEGTKETNRSQAESEAYERARAFDIATIERQAAQLLQVQGDNSHLHIDNRRLNAELQDAYAERDALRNEIRVMHDQRTEEREDSKKLKLRLAIAEGRPKPSEEELTDGYSEPGPSYPDLD